MARIYEINSVDFMLLKSNPPSLVILAQGKASTTGWTNLRLEPWVYTQPPPDGIWDFDFVGDPPTATNLKYLTPAIAAPYIWEGWSWKELRGVRVHSITNQLMAEVGAPAETRALHRGLDLHLSEPLRLERLADGEDGPATPKEAVLVDPRDLEAFFEGKPPTDIKLEDGLHIAVGAGTMNSGGYHVRFLGARLDTGGIMAGTVHVFYEVQESDEIVPQFLTKPYAIGRIHGASGMPRVIFHEK